MAASLHPATVHLGSLLREYRRSRTNGLYFSLCMVLFSIGAFIFLFAVLIMTARNTPVAIIGGVIISIAGLLILQMMFNKRFRVHVYEHALVYTRDDVPTKIVRWDEIESVTVQAVTQSVNFIPLGTFYTFLLKTKTGETAKLTNAIQNVAELGMQIQRVTLPHLLPQAQDAYRQGQEVSFGKLRVSQAGLSIGRKTLLWNELRTVTISGGYIRITKHGKWLAWAMVAVAKTPNLPVLLAFIEQHTTISY